MHWRSALTALCLLLAACAAPLRHPTGEAPATQMATTANPLATQAALQMLAGGGAPIDAAIAAQMVLGLVEPQSSGIGGGTLALYWDAQSRRLSSYDGLAAAPRRITPALAIDTDGSPLEPASSQRGGRTVGVPGTLALLEQMHQQHGKLPWATLFSPAIALAEQGFAMPRYLHSVLNTATAAQDHPDMRELFFGPDGNVLPIGSLVKNPVYAQTLRTVAEQGYRSWLAGGAAREIVAAAQRGYRASLMTEQDLLSYRAEPREPLCAPYLRWSVCMMGPSSFGGIVVLQMLQMLQTSASFDFDDAEFVHRYAEAGRLAQADRRRHVGDPAFTVVPAGALLAPSYLHERAQRIDPARALRETAGGLQGATETNDATSQIAVVDAAGNALSITTTINLNFGSRLMVGGFVLNNALTNFVSAPRPGQAVANRMEAGKRPITSMAPTIVFDAAGTPVLVGGSAGGGQIVDYIAASLIEMLANGRTPAQALARGHISTANAPTVQLEHGTSAAALAPALSAKGHRVEVVELTSGLGFLKRHGNGWIGAADPRRDGVALGP